MKTANPKRLSHLSSGKGFYQEKRGYIRNKVEIYRECPAALIVWEFLKDQSTRFNVAHFTEGAIFAETGLSRATLFRAYRILEERPWIEREGAYVHLNANLYWRGIKPGTWALARLRCEPVIPSDAALPESIKIALRSA